MHNCCLQLSDTSVVRVTHALEVIAIFLKSLFRKKFSNFGYEVINVLGGFDRGDAMLKMLVSSILKILESDFPGKKFR